MTSAKEQLKQILQKQISDANLAFKWAAREKSSKSKEASVHMKFMGLSPKQYRKFLSNNTNVVENLICRKQWDSIEFGKLPSVASARYQKAFWRNAESAYRKYVESLTKGEAKINAGAVFPYDVVKSARYGDAAVAEKQWEALPDFLAGSENSGILPVVDVSGSMTCPAGGYGSRSVVTCLDVAVSLGLYLSERNRGVFKDQFVTFSRTPQFVKLTGSLRQRLTQMERSNWEMNTDLEAVFTLLLNSAVQHKVPESQMPETILILSDMQFDSATGVYNRRNPTGHEMIEQKYSQAGYNMPKVVYWNINSSNGVPVEFDKSGTALVSGFSPAIMKSILRSENFTPIEVMKSTVMSDRYDW